MNRRTWIAVVGATLGGIWLGDGSVRALGAPSSDGEHTTVARRLLVDTTVYRTVAADRLARPTPRSVDFSNDAVWAELVTPVYAQTARRTPFHPDADASHADVRGLGVITAVLLQLAERPDHRLTICCRREAVSLARARAVLALLEGDRDRFVRMTAGDAAILGNAQARAAYFDMLEAEAIEGAGTTRLAWLRSTLRDDVAIARTADVGHAAELVELVFVAPADVNG